jgi:digeranylgeranylglycerophospholipid reductase
LADSFDAIVVGAGCAGAVFSARMAERGFRVLLIDRKREEELGQDSCDLVEKVAFETAGVGHPEPPELESSPKRMQVVSPDTSVRFDVQPEPFMVVNRRLLARRLLKDAADAGAEVKTQCIVGGVEIDGGFVTGVKTDRGSFRCRLAAGASGLDRVLCREMPAGMGIPRRIRTSDYLSVYAETREFRPASSSDIEKGMFEYHVGRYGGYSWVYRDSGDRVSVGSAVSDVPGSPDPRSIVLGYVRSNLYFSEGVAHRAGGRIPTRRPLNTMVASGIVVLGDAACQSVPIIGRGVGGAMTGGFFAADAASYALEAGDVSEEGLWSYNHNYMANRGADLAALDCLRLFLQNITEKEMTWSMEKGIIDSREIAGSLVGRFEVPGTQAKLMSLLRGISSMPLLVRFENALRKAQRVLELYKEYPREYYPPEFDEWSQESDFLFEDIENI